MPVRFPRIPKVRVRAELVLADGSVLSGYVFVEATVRVLDLMNGPTMFFPFIDQESAVQLINKAHVVRMTPHD